MNNHDHSNSDINASLFAHLVASLATSAIQHLGKILNPSTQKAEVNLEAAQATIDMLDMLAAKTQGNLDDKESKLIKGILAELKLNYVETLNEKPVEPAKPEKPPEPAG